MLFLIFFLLIYAVKMDCDGHVALLHKQRIFLFFIGILEYDVMKNVLVCEVV